MSSANGRCRAAFGQTSFNLPQDRSHPDENASGVHPRVRQPIARRELHGPVSTGAARRPLSTGRTRGPAFPSASDRVPRTPYQDRGERRPVRHRDALAHSPRVPGREASASTRSPSPRWPTASLSTWSSHATSSMTPRGSSGASVSTISAGRTQSCRVPRIRNQPSCPDASRPQGDRSHDMAIVTWAGEEKRRLSW